MPQLGQHAAPVQLAGHLGGVLPARALISQARHGVVRDQVQHHVLAAEQAHQALDLVVAVIDAGQQRPLQLHRIAGAAGVDLGRVDQLVGAQAWRARQQLLAQLSPGGVQRQSQRRLDAAQRQALKHSAVAHGREHQILVPDVAGSAQQLDRLDHVVEVVRGLAHAHEHHLLDRPQRARQRHLGDDLGAAHLAQQPALAGHAKHASHRAANLAGHAQAVTRQQHALNGLAIGQRHQQAG